MDLVETKFISLYPYFVGVGLRLSYGAHIITCTPRPQLTGGCNL